MSFVQNKIQFVLIWTFSDFIIILIVYGDQSVTAYSMICNLTRDLYNAMNASLLRPKTPSLLYKCDLKCASKDEQSYSK